MEAHTPGEKMIRINGHPSTRRYQFITNPEKEATASIINGRKNI